MCDGPNRLRPPNRPRVVFGLFLEPSSARITVSAMHARTVGLVLVVAGSLACITACRPNEGGDNRPSSTIDIPDSPVDAARPAFVFTDMTAASAVDATYHNGREAGHIAILESLGGGAAIVDADRDGLLDLFAVGGGAYEGKNILGLPGRLFRNQGDWKFGDISQPAGRGFPSKYYSHGCFPGDFDNDGFDDLLITGYGGIQFWRNQGDGTFEERTAETGIVDELWSSAAGWGDVDGDGWIDLYVAHYVDWSFSNHPKCQGSGPDIVDVCPPKVFAPLPDKLFRNAADGTFLDVSEESGLRKGGKGLGVVLGDIDLDGDLDIYVANDTTENFLYFNDGRGVFRESAVISGVAVDDRGTPNGSMGVDLGDYNLDGRPDIWVANFEVESFALYRNDGNEQFLHVSRATGVTALGGLFVGFGTMFHDLDRDGDEDIVVANGHVVNHPRGAPVLQLPLLLVNENGRRFQRFDFHRATYFGSPHAGRGLSVGDFDNDGDSDLVFVNNEQPLALLRNDTAVAGRGARLALIGTTANRGAIGAHVFLRTRNGKQLRLVKGGTSYLAAHDPRLDWGIAPSDEPIEFEIHWPGGSVQKVACRAGRVTRVAQPLGPDTPHPGDAASDRF
ncbi:MAG: CRTAC1 family protein [Planctomycetes bacterium]|nr:CRTAC1 family protein [Planctomycetota bacterium]